MHRGVHCSGVYNSRGKWKQAKYVAIGETVKYIDIICIMNNNDTMNNNSLQRVCNVLENTHACQILKSKTTFYH